MISSPEKIKSFLQNVKEAVEFFEENVDGRCNIYSHIDCDGLTAASIIAKAMFRMDIEFKVRIFKQLTEKEVNDIKNDNRSFTILTDFGSGQVDILLKKLKDRKILILDHHEPLDKNSKLNSGKIIQVNPHLHGINGALEISAAGVTYLFARELNRKNKDLAWLAVIGAIGDRQDKGEKGSLVGVNHELILKDAIDTGLVQEKIDIRLYGADTRPIFKSLEYSIHIPIPGLIGDETACIQFLRSMGIKLEKEDGSFRTLSDLTKEEKRLLVSSLIRYMNSIGIDMKKAEDIIGKVYILTRERNFPSLRNAVEFSTVLNICGRLGMPSLGISICLGDRSEKLMHKVDQIAIEYRKKLAEYLRKITKEPASIAYETKYLFVIDGRDFIDEQLIGTLASIVSSSPTITTKPVVLGFTYKEDDKSLVKISSRISPMYENDISLAEAMSKATAECGGRGGGHSNAAGGEIPTDKIPKFVKLFDKYIGEQVI